MDGVLDESIRTVCTASGEISGGMLISGSTSGTYNIHKHENYGSAVAWSTVVGKLSFRSDCIRDDLPTPSTIIFCI